ncbi:MAG: HAMP domain-containing sensor histidine kinase [Pseudomonadota bacterium]
MAKASAFKAPSPDVFRPARRSWLRPSAYGLSRLSVAIAAVIIALVLIFTVSALAVANLRATVTDAVTQSLLVQADAAVAALTQPANGPSPLAALDADADEDEGATSQLRRRLAIVLEGSTTTARLFRGDGERAGDTTADATPAPAPTRNGVASFIWSALSPLWMGFNGPAEPPEEATHDAFPEVVSALAGVKQAIVRQGANGEILISVAAPIPGDPGAVAGALQLRSAPGAVSAVVAEREVALVGLFLLFCLIAIASSVVLAATLTRPIRRLAGAADRIRKGGASTPMPELSDGGEIGELSRVLHDMTRALYGRIDAIEAFAGEVAHELKNPLTSLRSAVETLPLARNEAARTKLLDVIQHDVRRIDRLISDISDASKLDAELNRYRYERLDLLDLLEAVVAAQAEIGRERGQSVELVIRGNAAPNDFEIFGNDSRLSQVFTNLIDNARSFTPDGRRVVITAQRFAGFIEAVVDDEGPGIAEDSLERIFERFYTDRSAQRAFGDNSGLGLAISRQIIEAHNGEIFAENRYRTTLGPDRDVAGARFTVRLPAD